MIWGAVEPAGITGSAPGLTGKTKAVDDSVEYTAAERVRYKRPKVPFPRLDWTYAAFEFNLRWTSEIFLYFGAPTIGSIVWNGNTSAILSIEGGMMMGCLFFIN